MHAQSWIPEADWTTIDATIRRLAQMKSALEVEIGRWLLAARRAWPKAPSAFGSLGEYVGRLLGYDERKTREKLRVAESLEALPQLTAELAAGRRSWSAVRELTRVVTAHTERAWLSATDGMTVRQIEDAVCGRRSGDQPDDAKDPLLTPRRFVFDLLPEDAALIEEAFELVREEIGPGASRAEALKAMAERVLGGRPDRAPAYQTSLTVCVGCERTWQQAGGDLVEVPPEAAGCARCDGEVVGFTAVDEGIVAPHVGHEAATEPVEAPGGPANAPANTPAVLAALEGLEGPIGARALVRWVTKIFGVPLRSVTPRLRAAVKARDRGRCVVPGCRNFRFVELHHVEPRHRGGPNTAENIRCLCTRHHHAVHAGLLAIERTPNGLEFRHADGARYGTVVAVEARAAG